MKPIPKEFFDYWVACGGDASAKLGGAEVNPILNHECQMKFNAVMNFGGEPEPIPGLEVTEGLDSIVASEFAGLGIECDATSLQGQHLRETAPTTMRRWDQHFGRSSELQNTVEWTPSQSAEPGIWATLTNGTRVYGDKEWVDKMVAYYGKKAEPPQVRVEAQNRAPQFKMTRGPTDDEVRIFLVGETPAEADPMAILAAEYAKACEAETAVDWQDMRFVDGNAYGAQIAVHTPKRAQGTVLWTSEKREPQPKRSPSAKPALTSLSIEAPLGNRYGGLGWCDED